MLAAGLELRSDLRVTFEPRTSGGIDLELDSRVAPYYGNSIGEQAKQILAALGVENARLCIHDQGALPFAIAARIEAAVRRAGLGQGRRALPDRTAPHGASPRDRLRRSRLYLPGSEPKYFVSAGLHLPDAIILDLEDSVHPAEKDAARLLARNALLAVDFGAAERMVRINQLPLGLADLEEIVPAEPDLILIPKAEHPEQLVEVERRVRELQPRGSQSAVWLMAIIESALGVENAFSIARASQDLVALALGLEDYAADLGVGRSPEGHESLYARMRLVNAARAAHIQAIDSVYTNVADVEGLRKWAQASRALGFQGMGCIHPAQITVIHEAFAPKPAEIERALKIVAAYELARESGAGVVSVGSKMVDAPVLHQALRLVEQARALGLLDRGTPRPADSGSGAAEGE
jgi:citrate lyase subunit beta / citryl-CoA lyase